MARVSTGRSELEVTVRGEGEPVLFIHGGFFGGAIFDRLCQEPPLRDHYQLITYDRHGYGKSSRPQEPYSLDDLVGDALAVLQHAGANQAHVVGHSAGGSYALQLAMDHPDAVRSVTVIEPGMPTPAQQQFFEERFAPAGEAFMSGDSKTALDVCFEAVYGNDRFRDEMGPFLPDDAFDLAEESLGYGFMFESSVLNSFTLSPEEATRIRQPLLILQGEQTEPVFVINNELLESLVPHAEKRVVPGANHMCQVLNPAGTASALASFFARNRIGMSSAARD
jgi:pimeloyl-ACP methyl ester carboxylesterase